MSKSTKCDINLTFNCESTKTVFGEIESSIDSDAIAKAEDMLGIDLVDEVSKQLLYELLVRVVSKNFDKTELQVQQFLT